MALTEEQCYEIAEVACDLCKYPADYKDSDDLIHDRCDHCPVFEKCWEFCDEKKQGYEKDLPYEVGLSNYTKVLEKLTNMCCNFKPQRVY